MSLPASAVLGEIPESAARGSVADVYADIRRVLGVPFVVLIYRVLATEPGRLERIWTDLAPNLGSEYGRRAAGELSRVTGCEVAPIACDALLRRGLDPALAAATLDGFRLANSTNILGLTALLAGVDGEIAQVPASTSPHPVGASLPMAEVVALAPSTIGLLERMSAPIAGDEKPVLIPSLLRCFAHDPGLLELLWSRLQPVVESPAFPVAVARIADRAAALSESLPYRVRRLDDEATREIVQRFFRAISAMIIVGSLIEQAFGAFIQDSTREVS